VSAVHVDLLRAVFDRAVDGIVIMDGDTRWIHANDAAVALFGRDRAELMGRASLPELITTLDLPTPRLSELARDGTQRGLWPLLLPDGRLRYLEFHAVANVAPGMHLTMLRDATERFETEKALRNSERRFRALVEQSRDIKVVCDQEGIIRYSNPATRTILGVAPEELVGKRRGFDFVHPDDVAAAAQAFDALASTADGEQSTTVRVQHTDGSLRVVDIVGRNHSDDPRVGGLVIQVHDVTERVFAQQQLQHEGDQHAWLQSVIDQLPESVVVIEPGGSVLANQRARAHSVGEPGTPRQFDLRTPEGERVLDDDTPLARARRGEAVADADLVLHVGDRAIPVLMSAAPVSAADQSSAGAVCVWRDMSNQRALTKLRDEWAAIVAHDLQQPLSVIRMSDEALAKLLPSDHAARRALERIRLSAARMGAMIAELADTSLLEAGRMRLRFERVAIEALLRELAQELSSTASANGATIVVDAGDDIVINADAARLRQIFGNLVSNACKYGAKGRPIRVRAELLETAATTAARVTVENEGSTIAPKDLARLFERFYRSEDAHAGDERGLGLGLYIVRGLVAAHGGEVFVSSRDGKTRFEVILPVDAAPAKA
jgi:PAS domain S-box-containing protein